MRLLTKLGIGLGILSLVSGCSGKVSGNFSIGSTKQTQLTTPINSQIKELLPSSIDAEQIFYKTRDDMDHDGTDEIVACSVGHDSDSPAYLFTLKQEGGRWVRNGFVQLPFKSFEYFITPNAMTIIKSKPTNSISFEVGQDPKSNELIPFTMGDYPLQENGENR